MSVTPELVCLAEIEAQIRDKRDEMYAQAAEKKALGEKMRDIALATANNLMREEALEEEE